MSEEDFESPPLALPPPHERRRALRAAMLALVVLAVVLVLGSLRVIGMRSAQAEALQRASGSQQKVFVIWTRAQPGGSDGNAEVLLPGTLVGGRSTPVFARSSGYVRSWKADIGAHVRHGDLIAEVATPELDQQITQARATQRQAAANLDLARETLTRWQELRKDDLVTEQDVTERRSSVEQLTAAHAASGAEVARLQALAGFERVEAPFDGVITRRNVEVGTLVNAASSGSGQPLFQLDSTDRLRLELFVPQTYAAHVRRGMAVDITQAELPGQHFQGTVARSAGAIDSATRTLQVEVELPNRGGQLLPGTYVQAGLALQGGGALAVPANALLFRAEGPRLALVDEQGKVHLAPIRIGRDFGKTIEILGGIQPADHVILNPPDSIADGDQVEAREAPQPKPEGAPAGGAKPAAAGAAPGAAGGPAASAGK